MRKAIVFFTGAFFALGVRAAAPGADFQIAAQLLSAARSGNAQMVERLIASGANVNYIDGTGMSIVCTAIMNDDMRAAQTLQFYGADASKCNSQIQRYKNRLAPEKSGGLFSGLSNAQNMTLAAGGAALVVGGVYLLSGSLFGASGGTSPSGGGGNRGGGGNGNNSNLANARTSTAYGPAEWNFDKNKPKQTSNQAGSDDDNYFNLAASKNIYSSTELNNKVDFNHMSGKSDSGLGAVSSFQVQNYLLMMGGYAPLARGYNGQITPRDATTKNPVRYEHSGFAPISVALLVNNGVNALGGDAGTAAQKTMTRYSADCTTGEVCARQYNRYENLNLVDGKEKDGYDFSGVGSVFNSSQVDTFNPDGGITDSDSKLAKIIVGGGEHDTGDFIGFMPNGQLVLYRTGGGKKYVENLGTYHYDSGAKRITYGGGTTIEDVKLGSDGFFYSGGDIYGVQNGKLWSVTPQAYRNYEALWAASTKGAAIIANAALPEIMLGAADVYAVASASDKRSVLLGLINDSYYYNNDPADTIPKADIGSFYTHFHNNSASNSPFIIWSAGEYRVGLGEGKFLNVQAATFDNAAPLAYSGLNHHFLTAVAVQLTKGTDDITSASGEPSFNDNQKYVLSSYRLEPNGDIFSSRSCGIAGLGGKDIDPWCFAAAGRTGEQAVAALAGAAGILKAAYFYMDMEYIFALMALTADGKYYSQAELDARYELPGAYRAELESLNLTGAEYEKRWKEYFAKAFGYGLVNLERATAPAKSLYFYGASGSVVKINNPSGNAYWSETPAQNRAATVFSPSKVYGARSAVISTPMFDVIQGADGETLPRVFDGEFSFSGGYGLDLKDLLSEINLGGEEQSFPGDKLKAEFQPSDIGGIKKLNVGYGAFSMEYRERGGGRTFQHDNPFLAMASNVFSTEFSSGNFTMTAFSGSITDDALLANDPVVSNNFAPAKLGGVYGVGAGLKKDFGRLRVGAGAGYVNEDSTVLGAYSGGLFDMGGGKTFYANAELRLGALAARYVRARTTGNPGYGFISDMSGLESDSYSLSADLGKWSLQISRPLAIVRGSLEYVKTDYEIKSNGLGYDLITSPHLERLDLSPEYRETRLAAVYRPDISKRTQLALGLVGRINPDNSKGFEEILILKIKRVW